MATVTELDHLLYNIMHHCHMCKTKTTVVAVWMCHLIIITSYSQQLDNTYMKLTTTEILDYIIQPQCMYDVTCWLLSNFVESLENICPKEFLQVIKIASYIEVIQQFCDMRGPVPIKITFLSGMFLSSLFSSSSVASTLRSRTTADIVRIVQSILFVVLMTKS